MLPDPARRLFATRLNGSGALIGDYRGLTATEQCRPPVRPVIKMISIQFAF